MTKSTHLRLEQRLEATAGIQRTLVTLDEEGMQLRLTVIDTPGFAQKLNNDKWFVVGLISLAFRRCSWEPLLAYINKTFEKYLDDESRINRGRITDARVHCVLYFIEPTGHGCAALMDVVSSHCGRLKALDIAALKALAPIVNLIPVIGKADMLTKAEEKAFKATARRRRSDGA